MHRRWRNSRADDGGEVFRQTGLLGGMMGRKSCKRGSAWENDGGVTLIDSRNAWEYGGEAVLRQGMLGRMMGKMC